MFIGLKWGVPKPQKYDFSLKLTRVSEAKEGRALSWRVWRTLRPWRQVRPHWEYAVELVLIAATRAKKRTSRATTQMERALRRDNWL